MDASPSPIPLPPIPPGRAMRPIPEIPDHEIVRQIGSGAYGEVWLAVSLTGAWRAVKIVWRDDFDDERTFNREFEGIEHYEPIARNHPGLVHILHVGRKDAPSQLYYYVMELGDDAQNGVHINAAEYIPRTLQTDKRLAGGKPLPLDYCLEVGSQLSHALIYLHSKNLTHRDIKPANVIFVNGRPKLADIGLVALRDQRSFVGTEGFIPPDGPGTRRADVYALAKVLYEISTGKDRLDFPELPDVLPSDTPRKKWLHFNNVICAAAEPRLDHCSIITAEALAEALDSLRGYSVHPKFKRPRKKRRMNGTTKIFLSAVAGGCISLLAITGISEKWLDWNQGENNSVSLKKDEEPPPDRVKNGYVFISSVPSGASIYDSLGNYVDETPYGPILMKAGQHILFTLKKDGFADWKESGVIPSNDTLSLGGELNPYNPPRDGENWVDSSGMVYLPEGASHESASPLTAACFGQFLNEEKDARNIPHQFISESSVKNSQGIVMITPEGMASYLAWLTRRCEKEGILSKEFTISAKEVPGFASDGDQLKAYRLAVTKIHQTSVTIRTSPEGALVFLNNSLIGRTPLENRSIPRSPYSIEIKLPGYAPINRNGLDPEGLDLSLQLEKDHSVVFSEPWVNGIGMGFIPLKDKTLAQTHEVRAKDYKFFLKKTDHKQPEKTVFKQGDDHPAVNMTRDDAERFAAWLTEKERKARLIEKTDSYRLPSDEEWSLMAGVNEEKGETPYDRSLYSATRPGLYFWGESWPPSRKTGNFADVSALDELPSSRVIIHYEDEYPFTAPVASFSPNSKGFFDIDGNVQEWTSDEFGGPPNFKFRNNGVVRGGNYLSFRPGQLEKTARTPVPTSKASPSIGFRLVLIREIPSKEEKN